MKLQSFTQGKAMSYGEVQIGHASPAVVEPLLSSILASRGWEHTSYADGTRAHVSSNKTAGPYTMGHPVAEANYSSGWIYWRI